MGCVPDNLNLLLEHVRNVGSLPGCHMMELGDQQMYCHPNIPEGSAAKSYFERFGVRHTSIDLNGELGAIALDLSKPIENPDWMGTFDVVTDFGTSEHVGQKLEALYECRKNVHNFCRVRGLMVFANPKTGHWPRHGYHYFTKAHYEKLAGPCHYALLEVSEHPALHNTVDGWEIRAALLKADKIPFPSFEEFKAICEGTVFPS